MKNNQWHITDNGDARGVRVSERENVCVSMCVCVCLSVCKTHSLRGKHC